jgi:hypothetical protein
MSGRVTIVVATEEAAADAPYVFVAVTLQRTNFITSAAATVYEAVAVPVPVAFAQPVEPSDETCHW